MRIEYVSKGVKCDHCPWKLEIDDISGWVNKPCPDCGQNVLTQEDYVEWAKIKFAMDMINSMSDEDFEKFDAIGDGDEYVDGTIDIKDGKINIDIKANSGNLFPDESV